MASVADWRKELLGLERVEKGVDQSSAPGATFTDQMQWIRPPSPCCLFVDFDGVLHSGCSDTFRRLDLLEQVLDRHPFWDVIISSDWRLGASVPELQDYFSPRVSDRVVGKTGVVSTYPCTREKEITTFAVAAMLHHWIAVDDDHSEFSPECSFLHATDAREGLTPSDLESLSSRMAALEARDQ